MLFSSSTMERRRVHRLYTHTAPTRAAAAMAVRATQCSRTKNMMPHQAQPKATSTHQLRGHVDGTDHTCGVGDPQGWHVIGRHNGTPLKEVGVVAHLRPASYHHSSSIRSCDNRQPKHAGCTCSRPTRGIRPGGMNQHKLPWIMGHGADLKWDLPESGTDLTGPFVTSSYSSTHQGPGRCSLDLD